VSGVEDLQQRPWHEEASTQVDNIPSGASQVSSHDFHGESQKSSLHSLYLAMVLLNELLWDLGLSAG
jgi:hypothetical protein